MNTISKILVIAVSLLANVSWSQGMVWEIVSGDHKLYVGGTVHLLAAEDYPLPKAFDTAYNAADSLIFEMDLALQNAPEFQQAMMDALFYKNGQQLDEVLDEATWQLFKQWCNANNISSEAFILMKPGLASVTISLTELAKLGVTQDGVDTYYYQKAVSDNKSYIGLETMQQQIGLLENMGAKHPNLLLQQTLNEVDEIADLFPKIKQAWKENNITALDELLVEDMRVKQVDLYQDLLVKRNQQWLKVLDAELLDNGVEFVLVGAAHLVGSQGLLKHWQAQGYKVTAVQ